VLRLQACAPCTATPLFLIEDIAMSNNREIVKYGISTWWHFIIIVRLWPSYLNCSVPFWKTALVLEKNL
jgi:hypothetical protein